MNQCSIPYPDNRRQYAKSWGISLLLHGLAVSSAVILLGDLKLEPQPEPFKWEVSMVQPSEPTAESQPAQSESQPAPTPKPQARKPVQPTPQPVQQQTVVETVPPPVQQQVVRQPVHEPPREEIKEAKPIVEMAQQPAPAVSQPVEPQKPVEPAVVAAAPPAQQPMKAEPQPQDISTAPASVAAPPVVAREAPAPSPPAPPAPPAMQEAPARDLASPAGPPAKTDFGWLAHALWERVGHLKKYPHLARLKHVEGRVVVRAVITASGHLARAEVVQSSGSVLLDEDALDTLHRACPLHLAQPLGRAEVVVQIPINYRLN